LKFLWPSGLLISFKFAPKLYIFALSVKGRPAYDHDFTVFVGEIGRAAGGEEGVVEAVCLGSKRGNRMEEVGRTDAV